MAKGYLIAQVTVTDPDAYARYGKVAGELLRAAGVRQILDPDTAIVAEGAPKDRSVIFEFDSFAGRRRSGTAPSIRKASRCGAAPPWAISFLSRV